MDDLSPNAGTTPSPRLPARYLIALILLVASLFIPSFMLAIVDKAWAADFFEQRHWQWQRGYWLSLFRFSFLGYIAGIVLLHYSPTQPRIIAKRTEGAAIAVLLLIVVTILANWSNLAIQREKSHSPSCLRNQREISTAVLMYTQDHNEQLKTKWEQLFVYLGYTNGSVGATDGRRVDDIREWNSFYCPTTCQGFQHPKGYGLNAAVIGKRLSASAPPTEILLTADAYGAFTFLRDEGDIDHRHSGGYVASFCDGHAKYIYPTEKHPIRWR